MIGTTWQLVSLQPRDSTPVQVPDPSRYRIRFTENDNVEINSDCNSCGGQFELNGSSLSVRQVVCTRVFCGEQSLDQRFVAALEGARLVATSDEELVIQGDGATLRFRR